MNHFQCERVFFRELTQKDWIDVHKYASQEMVCQFQPWGPNTQDESLAYVNKIIEDTNQLPRSRYAFAIILKENERMIGVGEINIRDRNNRIGEITYIINPDHWGNGYATEVAEMLINFGFCELKFHRLFATCDPRNIGSSRVLEKVGMTKEGRIREGLWIKDGWRDSLLFSILEQEWEQN
ncbi:RimJ/RimL family protein N-acetyltransferase [Bacillus pakistanensis]|uniref:RimJ/RimL family protein N-acetyltransferase n=1 Tax=Rossellomorea pakistanensis TaxID=992288 RepID=A0ABS2N788_9BACI|nr:GNAT family N-acetyltransferase [Bacillus pakistanensis]MBM7583665.1 RimJ/RimL family protein N-acetyltransferase [Bacillus pakistanensis]